MKIDSCQKGEAREFWIEKFNGHKPSSYFVHLEEPKQSTLSLTRGGKEIPGSEYFHLIERSAYVQLEEKLRIAVGALEKAKFALQMMIISHNGPVPGLTDQQVFDGSISTRDAITEALSKINGAGK